MILVQIVGKLSMHGFCLPHIPHHLHEVFLVLELQLFGILLLLHILFWSFWCWFLSSICRTWIGICPLISCLLFWREISMVSRCGTCAPRDYGSHICYIAYWRLGKIQSFCSSSHICHKNGREVSVVWVTWPDRINGCRDSCWESCRILLISLYGFIQT